jgi:hypothetical protein
LKFEHPSIKFIYMKTVISASRRTDIPAFYLDWLMNAIKAGYVDVRNPFFKKHIYRVDLLPEKVAWIVFWSRHYGKFLKYSQFFTPYRLFFHFTILSHHPLMEKAGISLNRALQQMEQLVKRFGADHVIWRYDPLIAWKNGSETESNFNLSEFQFLCRRLSDLGIRRCYFSIVSPYRKFKHRFRKHFPGQTLLTGNDTFIKTICHQIKETAAASQIDLYSCCNDALIDDSIQKGHCISGTLLNRLAGEKTVSEAKTPTRADCGCTRSVDIGSYSHHPCHFGCLYCYANPVV